MNLRGKKRNKDYSVLVDARAEEYLQCIHS